MSYSRSVYICPTVEGCSPFKRYLEQGMAGMLGGMLDGESDGGGGDGSGQTLHLQTLKP